jgi:hypothetical protein
MWAFEADSVTVALQYGLEHLLRDGLRETSRNGPVLVAPGPVMTEYTNPRRRVLFSPTRDANPFFHFFEALWMLSGSNDIEFPCYFLKNYSLYSDDGRTMWDAYGWRWRTFFGWDQLDAIVAELRSNPESRRCVLSMWNPWPHAGDYDHNYERDAELGADLTNHDFHVATHGGKAVPCNTHCYLDLRGGRLNMTVCNRSNDILWGCYGANQVQFSMLLEYLAVMIGVPMGVYRQFSNNLHAYTARDSEQKLEQILHECQELHYEHVEPDTNGPFIEQSFNDDLFDFMLWATAMIRHDFKSMVPDVPQWRGALFSQLAEPMFMTWWCRKADLHGTADQHLASITAADWRRACTEWVERRKQPKEAIIG